MAAHLSSRESKDTYETEPVHLKDYQTPFMTVAEAATKDTAPADSAAPLTTLTNYSGLTMGDIERLFPHVPKFELSEEVYYKRSDSALKFLQAIKQPQKPQEEPSHSTSSFPDSATPAHPTGKDSESYKIGDAVVVLPGNRFGHIRYIGPFHKFCGNDGATPWYGIELNEPKGKHNGIIDGIAYFSCKAANHGIMVKAGALRLATCLWQDVSASQEDESLLETELLL
jgi:CAP-Gly domain